MSTSRMLAAFVFLFVGVYTLSVDAANNYVLIALPHGVFMELPRNWKSLSSNQMITLESSVQARAESIGIFDASSDLNFGANLYDEAKKTAAIANIRYYPNIELTQADAHAATTADVKVLDGDLRSLLTKAGYVSGYQILRWFGTSPHSINGNVAFITEYERSPLNNNGNFRVRLVRVFKGHASFTVTVSYRASKEYLLKPICDHIISSIKA